MAKGAVNISNGKPQPPSGNDWMDEYSQRRFAMEVPRDPTMPNPFRPRGESAGGSMGAAGTLQDVKGALEGAATASRPSKGLGAFPSDYYDKIPSEMRMSGSGISHPGFRWNIIDKQTGKQVGQQYNNRRRANTQLDKLDNAYGGYRHRLEPVRATDMSDSEKATLDKYGVNLQ